MSTATITPPDVTEARAEEIKRWEGHHTVLCVDGEGSGRHGTLTEVHFPEEGNPFDEIHVLFDFGEEGVWWVEPELVTLPTDDGPRCFMTFVRCPQAGDNVFTRANVFIEVLTDKPEETQAIESKPDETEENTQWEGRG